MSTIGTWAGIVYGILLRIAAIWLVGFAALLGWVVLAGWYRRFRRWRSRRREREAQASTLRARQERERREGAGLTDEERKAWTEIENHLSSEGKS